MDQVKSLHIVCHEIPYPADYGGVTDLFYKIKSLHEEGVKIKLHCFKHKRPEQPELNKYCESVSYYPRRSALASFSFRIPYIVSCRRSTSLIKRLSEDNDPILLEGIHCTYYLYKNYLAGRKVLVRLHNAEFVYYKTLYSSETRAFRKIYFGIEYRLLKAYEKKLAPKVSYAAVSASDVKRYEQVFEPQSITYVPVFLPFHRVTALRGKGTYCLYHGNLSVSENEKAVLALIEQVFKNNNIPFVIAGKNPSRLIKAAVENSANICLVENPGETDMMDLLQKAHIHVLTSFNKTGVKLKLLYALFCGRFVITNQKAVEESILEELCTICNSPSETRSEIQLLMQKEMSDELIGARKKILHQEYNNEETAREIMQMIW